MQSEWNDGQTEIDLSNTKVRPSDRGKHARIIYLKLVGKNRAEYLFGEKIVFLAHIRSQRAFSNLCMRIELRCGDDMPIGTAPILSLGKFEANERRKIEVSFVPTGLTEGKYRIDLVLFEVNEFGLSFDQDILLPAFRFEIPANEDIIWNQSNWGHIRFADACIIANEGIK